MTSSKSAQDFYKDTRDLVLNQFKQDLDDLHDTYQQKNFHISFNITKRQYIEYLIAHVVGSTLDIKTSPPLNVDALWHSHLLETESYRNLEKFIIDKFEEWKDGGIELNYIDHSVVKNREGRSERLKRTKDLYSMVLGFEPFSSDESLMERSNSCRKRKTRGGDDDMEYNRGGKNRRQTETADTSNGCFNIQVKSFSGKQYFCKVSKKTQMKEILGKYANDQGIGDTSKLRIIGTCIGLGRILRENETVEDLGLKENDTLVVHHRLTGC